MKPYTLIPLVVLVVVVLGGIFIVPSFESPQSKLNRQIDEQIELAQRMLYRHNAAAPNLRDAFERPADQPAQIDPGQWQAYMDLDENTPFATLRDRVSAREKQLQQSARELGQLSGRRIPPPSLPGAEQAYQQVLDELKSSHELLDQAISTIRQAVNLREGQGESEVSGRQHPNATRLEAILLHHKADLLRREAALIRAKANLDRKRVEWFSGLIREVDEKIGAQNLSLAGGSAPGKVTSRPRPAPATGEPAAPQPEPAEESAPATDRRDDQAGESGGWWIFSGLADRAKSLKLKIPGVTPAPEPETVEARDVAEAPAVTTAEEGPVVERAPAGAVPSLPQRIAGLQRTRAEAQDRIRAAETQVEGLNKRIEELRTRYEAAQAKAREAQLKMMEAEQKGANVSDPQAVQRFVNEYRKLSEAHRKAALEAAALRDGALRNSRSVSTDPDEILNSPLVPVDESKPVEPERGLAALEKDLALAQRVLDTNKELLAEVDRQIAGLGSSREAVEARLEELKSRREELASGLARHVAAACDAVLRAGQLEIQAIEIAEGPGQQAAQNAQSAASDYQRRKAEFIRRENHPDTPDRKLQDMASDQFTTANAVALQADLNYLLARTCEQQAADLELHARMLGDLDALDAPVKAKLDLEQLPEGLEPDSALVKAAVSAEEAGKLAAEARGKASEAARQALDQYSQAATQSKDLWVMYAQMAAVHNLLATLPRAADDTEDHLAAARETYARAIAGREQRPEYASYRRIFDSLRETPREQ